jgi:hypothetical protein
MIITARMRIPKESSSCLSLRPARDSNAIHSNRNEARAWVTLGIFERPMYNGR